MKRSKLKIHPDDWVSQGTPATPANQPARPAAEVSAEPTKRLTLDLPASLHQAFKVHAATQGHTMVELLRAHIEALTQKGQAS